MCQSIDFTLERKLRDQVAELLPWAEIGALVHANEYPYIDDFTDTGVEFLKRIESGEFEEVA